MDKGERRLEVSIGHIRKERNKRRDTSNRETERESDRQEKKEENERERRRWGRLRLGDKGGR